MRDARARQAMQLSTVGVVRGILAVGVLAALGIGIPVALLSLGSTSLGVLADVSGLVDRLTGPDDGTLFLAVLTLTAWAGWATFVLAVALEIPAQLRGVRPVRIRGLGLQQSLAGGLVAAALTVLLLPGAASASERVAASSAAARPTAPRHVTSAPSS